MIAITLNNAKSNLDKIIQQTIDNQEETIITTDNGAVVMIDQDNWNSMMETLRLLKDKRALRSLLDSIEARKGTK